MYVVTPSKEGHTLVQNLKMANRLYLFPDKTWFYNKNENLISLILNLFVNLNIVY